MRYSKYVSTKIGIIDNMPDPSVHGDGNTHPGAIDTLEAGNNVPHYNYHHKTTKGFSINHQAEQKYHPRAFADTIVNETNRNQSKNVYVKRITVNGKPNSRKCLTWDDISNGGGAIRYDEPCETWATELLSYLSL